MKQYITLKNLERLWLKQIVSPKVHAKLMANVREEFIQNDLEQMSEWSNEELLEIIRDLWQGDATAVKDMPDEDVLRACCECAECGDDIVDHLLTAVEHMCNPVLTLFFCSTACHKRHEC